MSSVSGRYLAVVPARGGSKRVPRKNIRPFHGVPLLGRTIQTLSQANVFDAVVVSTDDPEIAEVGRCYGAVVPFTRPGYLADDRAPTSLVVKHALDMMESKLGSFDAVCCVYPGAVLMRCEDYQASSQLLHRTTRDESVVAVVVRSSHPIERSLQQGPNGLLEPKFESAFLRERTQDLEATWFDAGQFYWASPRRWRMPAPLLESVVPYEVPAWRVQDIDTEDDWIRAEMIYSLVVGVDSVSEIEAKPD